MRVLVTGANGFLGQHIVNALLSHHFEVNVIVRNNASIYFDQTLVNVFIGSFTDPLDLEKAMFSCDSILHCASTTSIFHTDYFDFHRVNVAASQKLLSLVEMLKFKSVVYISTSNTVGNGTQSEMADESRPISYPFIDSFYARSKAEAENLFINFAQNNPSVHVIVLNPCFMVGDLDPKPSSGRLVLMGLKNVIFVPPGGKNFVSVYYVADIAVKAITNGKSGERYLVAGENLSFTEFYKKLATIGQFFQLRIVIPAFVFKILGYFGDLMTLLNFKVEFTSRNINQLLIQEYYSPNKTIREFKLNPYSLSEAISKSFLWFVSKKRRF